MALHWRVLFPRSLSAARPAAAQLERREQNQRYTQGVDRERGGWVVSGPTSCGSTELAQRCELRQCGNRSVHPGKRFLFRWKTCRLTSLPLYFAQVFHNTHSTDTQSCRFSFFFVLLHQILCHHGTDHLSMQVGRCQTDKDSSAVQSATFGPNPAKWGDSVVPT